MWHESTGIIKYDPYRPGLKSNNRWWCILKTDRAITDYYRWWVKKERWIELCKPSWGSHISIIRGEKPKPQLMHLWKKYDGKRITFQYNHSVRFSGDTTGDRPSTFWFLDIEAPELLAIREELELPSHWKLHLTIGRRYYE